MFKRLKWINICISNTDLSDNFHDTDKEIDTAGFVLCITPFMWRRYSYLQFSGTNGKILTLGPIELTWEFNK